MGATESMSDFIGGFLFGALVSAAILFVVDPARTEREQWRECRTLFATGDSATVVAAKPECRRWTWLQPEKKR